MTYDRLLPRRQMASGEVDRHHRFFLWAHGGKGGDKVHYCAASRTQANLDDWRRFREYEEDVLTMLVAAAHAIDRHLGQVDYPILFDRSGIWLIRDDGSRAKLGGRFPCDGLAERGRTVPR